MSEPLDNSLKTEQIHVEPALIPIVLRYGLIVTLLSAAFQMLLYAFDKHYSMIGMVGFIFPIIIVFVAINHFKKENGGYITLGKGFVVGLLVFMVAGILGWGFNYLYTEYIVSNYWEGFADNLEVMLERFGLSDEQIEQSIERSMRTRSNHLLQFGSTILVSALIGSIISIIAAAILKKERKMNF